MKTLLIVPCYNEASRWDPSYWANIVRPGDLDVLFVNDGSRDGTLRLLKGEEASLGASLVDLDRNRGKAEALRHGLLSGWNSGHDAIGYLDADGAFPASEVTRMADEAGRLLVSDGRSPAPYDAVWSARVLMAGRDIRRHGRRHYLGRIITTLIAPWHGYEIYDTQAGFKIFRKSDALFSCLQEPFHTKWFPDVEILQRWRLATGASMRLWEDPVTGWHDVPGSKMNAGQYQQILKDLLWVYRGRA